MTFENLFKSQSKYPDNVSLNPQFLFKVRQNLSLTLASLSQLLVKLFHTDLAVRVQLHYLSFLHHRDLIQDVISEI